MRDVVSARRPAAVIGVGVRHKRYAIDRLEAVGRELGSIGGRMARATKAMREGQSWTRYLLLPLLLARRRT